MEQILFSLQRDVNIRNKNVVDFLKVDTGKKSIKRKDNNLTQGPLKGVP